MKIAAVDEYNKNGHLIFSDNYVGAYVRGKTKDEALLKFHDEIIQYSQWLGLPLDEEYETVIVQSKSSMLNICDADSDVLFLSEIPPLTHTEYSYLKRVVMKSAEDFMSMYLSIPDKNITTLPSRTTFYGPVPRTAQEMYDHTKSVNSYYFGEIGVDTTNEPDIIACRLSAFKELENKHDYLNNTVYIGSNNEEWTARKVMRRFIWHDRIHGKAMYKMAVKQFGVDKVDNPFMFSMFS